MNEVDQSPKEQARVEMFRHVDSLNMETSAMYQRGDPVLVFNNLHRLKSLIGQLESAAGRYMGRKN